MINIQPGISSSCFPDSELHPEIAQKKFKYLNVHPMSKLPKFLQTDNKSLFLIFGPLKVLYQFWALWKILGHDLRPARSLLVQVLLNLLDTVMVIPANKIDIW